MSKLFDHDNKVMQILAKVADILIISILWVVLSLTVVGFGPACTAAYYATAKCVRRDRGNVFREFWHALKSNFWRSLALGFIVIFFGISLFLFDFAEIANAVLNQQEMDTWRLLFSILKIFLFCGFFIYLFPIQSRFQAKLVRVVFTSLMMMFRHIGMTLVMIAVLLMVGITCIVYPYLAMALPGFLYYLFSFPMEKILLRLVAEDDLEEDEEKDQWYLE